MSAMSLLCDLRNMEERDRAGGWKGAVTTASTGRTHDRTPQASITNHQSLQKRSRPHMTAP